jgi:hypothetical protein
VRVWVEVLAKDGPVVGVAEGAGVRWLKAM